MNKFSLLLISMLFFGLSFAQTTTADLPHKEYRPYFKFKVFPSKTNKANIRKSLNYLQQKNNATWNKNDSIQFMLDLVLVGNYYSAYQLFLGLKLDTTRNIKTIHIVQHLLFTKNKMNRLNKWFDKEVAAYPQNKKAVEIRRRITQVSVYLAQDNWNFKDSIFFPELEDSMWFGVKEGSPQFKNKLIPMLKLYDTALRVVVKFQANEDKALAAAYVKLGDFIFNHVNYTDAYIAYNCARFYYRKSMYVSKKIKITKSALFDNNLLLPSIRDVFPKEKKGVFNYKILKKRVEQRIQDSIAAATHTPLKLNPIKQGKELLPFMSKNLLILIGFILILIFVVFFVKTKERK